MTKEDAITRLSNFKYEISIMPKFKGQAAAERKIAQSISYLMKYKVGGNIPGLIVREREAEFSAIQEAAPQR